MGKQDLTRFGFKMSFGRISYIARDPRIPNWLVVFRDNVAYVTWKIHLTLKQSVKHFLC